MIYLSYTISPDCNPVFSSDDGTLIDVDVFFPGLGDVRYTSSSTDPDYLHSEEIYNRALSGEFGPVSPYVPPGIAPIPDYIAFWDALITSDIYASIRSQSMTSLPMNTLATELIALLGDAKADRANEAAIQASMTAILATGTFTGVQLAELGAALEAGNLDGIYAP